MQKVLPPPAFPPAAAEVFPCGAVMRRLAAVAVARREWTKAAKEEEANGQQTAFRPPPHAIFGNERDKINSGWFVSSFAARVFYCSCSHSMPR